MLRISVQLSLLNGICLACKLRYFFHFKTNVDRTSQQCRKFQNKKSTAYLIIVLMSLEPIIVGDQGLWNIMRVLKKMLGLYSFPPVEILILCGLKLCDFIGWRV